MYNSIIILTFLFVNWLNILNIIKFIKKLQAKKDFQVHPRTFNLKFHFNFIESE